MKERPSGGRDENGLGFAGLGPENGVEVVLERELESADSRLGRELTEPVRGRDVPVDGPLERGLDPYDELPPLLNDFFCSIYCSKRPVFTGLN